MKRVNLLAASTLLIGQTFTGAVLAASVTLSGATVDFSFDDSLLGLFGTPRVAGDTLFFTPIDFEVRSLNGAGFALTDASINIVVTAHADQMFTSASLLERGDYLLLGSGSSADVSGQIRVFDTAAPLVDMTASIVPTSLLNLPGVPTRNWEATAMTDLSTWNSARSVNVTIENLLLAATGSSPSLAFVEKKFVGLTFLTTAVTPVPEAETYAMMLAGLGLVGWSVKRRRSLLAK